MTDAAPDVDSAWELCIIPPNARFPLPWNVVLYISAGLEFHRPRSKTEKRGARFQWRANKVALARNNDRGNDRSTASKFITELRCPLIYLANEQSQPRRTGARVKRVH